MVTSCAVGLDRQHVAGLHAGAVEVDGAGAAVAGVAPDDGAGLAELSRRYCTSSIRGSTSSETSSVDGEADPGHGRLPGGGGGVTPLTLGAPVGEWLAAGSRRSAPGGREPALEQRRGGVRAAAEPGQADLDDLGVVRRELAVAHHGVGLRVGEQRLADRDRDVVGELAERRGVRAGQQVAAVRRRRRRRRRRGAAAPSTVRRRWRPASAAGRAARRAGRRGPPAGGRPRP